MFHEVSGGMALFLFVNQTKKMFEKVVLNEIILGMQLNLLR